MKNVIKKLKSSLKKAAAIGLTSLALLSNANSQLPYPPRIAPPTARSQIALPLNEIEGERIIRSYLKRKNIVFRLNSPLNFRTREGFFYIQSDFKLTNNAVIEYWSPEDEQDLEFKKRDFALFNQELNMVTEDIMRRWLPEWQKQDLFSFYLNQRGILYRIEPISKTNIEYDYDFFGRLIKRSKTETNLYLGETESEKENEKTPPKTTDITITMFNTNYIIPKPLIFLDKKELYKKYEEIGGNIYYIETKNNVSGTKKELDKIIEEATKNIILTEKQAKNIIALYFIEKRIPYEENVNFKTNNIIINPDFLMQTKDKLPIAIEYLGDLREQKRKENIYEKYKQIGGKVYAINQSTKEELSNELEKIVNDILPRPSTSTIESTEPNIETTPKI